MATPIKRIEKDFLFKVLYDEQIPVVYLRDRAEYNLTLEKPVKTEVMFKTNRPIEGLKPRQKLDLMFDYKGQVITFSMEIITVRAGHITGIEPEALYKNLDRSFSRVTIPSDMKVMLAFLGDRYQLDYPRIIGFEKEEVGEFVKNIDPKNLTGLINQMAALIKGFASGYKLVIFKDQKPQSTEERIVAEMGKILFIPSTQTVMPENDPYPRPRIITDALFKRYLESTGENPAALNERTENFLKGKLEHGIYSDAWVPILFHEYVIGYVHIWIDREGLPPFSFQVLDTMNQFTKILAHSLKVNGYFEKGKVKNEPFDGKVIDISASGLLFCYPTLAIYNSLLPDRELAVTLVTPKRKVFTSAKIVRRYKDDAQGYFGCRFQQMAVEDQRFLFEFIYGKPFTDKDMAFLAGQV